MIAEKFVIAWLGGSWVVLRHIAHVNGFVVYSPTGAGFRQVNDATAWIEREFEAGA